MNIDTTNDDTISVEWTNDGDPVANNVQIAHNPGVCQNPFCYRTSALGSNYCERHGPDADPLTDITNPQPTPDPGPSRRDLQRQLDRIEGKLDALLNQDDD